MCSERRMHCKYPKFCKSHHLPGRDAKGSCLGVLAPHDRYSACFGSSVRSLCGRAFCARKPSTTTTTTWWEGAAACDQVLTGLPALAKSPAQRRDKTSGNNTFFLLYVQFVMVPALPVSPPPLSPPPSIISNIYYCTDKIPAPLYFTLAEKNPMIHKKSEPQEIPKRAAMVGGSLFLPLLLHLHCTHTAHVSTHTRLRLQTRTKKDRRNEKRPCHA